MGVDTFDLGQFERSMTQRIDLFRFRRELQLLHLGCIFSSFAIQTKNFNLRTSCNGVLNDCATI